MTTSFSRRIPALAGALFAGALSLGAVASPVAAANADMPTFSASPADQTRKGTCRDYHWGSFGNGDCADFLTECANGGGEVKQEEGWFSTTYGCLGFDPASSED